MRSNHISKEKQQLLDKAEIYYREWENARLDLERSSRNFGRKFVLILVVGLSLLYIFRLLMSDNDEQPRSNKRHSKAEGRLFKAAGNIALPFLIKGMKNIILNENDHNKESGEEYAD